MSKLIAESGSTKTDWRLILNNDKVVFFKTKGLNPYHLSEKSFLEIISSSELLNYQKEINELYFYGAGVSEKSKIDWMKKQFENCFKNLEKTEIYHDIFGAARAILQNEKGIIAILGTGSNSAFYNGKQITETIPSVGYILGDEGGGVDIGKSFLRKIIRGELSQEIIQNFEKKYSLSTSEILDKIYKEKFANRFIASFTIFVKENIENPQIYSIVEKSFMKFIKLNIVKYNNYEKKSLNVVGSVGYHFKDILEKVCEKHSIQLRKVNNTPIDGLVDYHKHF